jgi:hypothetical protein
MKVIDKMRNMMIQEFQHFVEFQLIEVMILEMLLTQFDSIVMVIRMTVTELFRIS